MAARRSGETGLASALLRLRFACLASTALAAVAAQPAAANPTGGSVVAGNAAISQPSSALTQVTQQSSRAIVNWQGFSIGSGETTQFVQPSASAVILNRVTGGDPSVIAGQLTANGNVVLVNPSGVAFVKGAQVNVNSIVATPSDIRNENFMAGNMTFDIPSPKPGAAVSNDGQITVKDRGLAALVAPGVANSGVIQAKLGRVVLAGAETFTVDLYGDGLINFAVGPKVAAAPATVGGKPTQALVDNSGQILADGGSVLLTAAAADAIVTDLVHAGGYIGAKTVGAQTGSIRVDGGTAAGGKVLVTGTLDASGSAPGTTGGKVAVLGDRVGILAGATVTASGDAGGGTILVGGNFHGAGPEPNASVAVVEPGAQLSADAQTQGNGGQIAVWSNKTTAVAGSLHARGGAKGGNGGMIETSSAGSLEVPASASVDVSAPAGASGMWTLDPTNVHVSDSPAAGDNVITFNGTLAAGTDAGLTDFISTTALAMALSTGNNVTIGATQNITFDGIANPGLSVTTLHPLNTLTLTAGGTINFTAGSTAINLGTNTTLSVNAPNIIVNAPITAGAVLVNGVFTFTLNSSLDTVEFFANGQGNVILNGSLRAGSITVLGGAATTLNGNVTSSGGQQYGPVTIGAGSGGVTLSEGSIEGIQFFGPLTGNNNNLTILNDGTTTFFPGVTVTGLRNLTLAPFTASKTIAVGDTNLASADVTYNFASAGLAPLLANGVANVLTIGNAKTAAITLNQFGTGTPAPNVALVTGGSINVAGAFNGAGLSLTAPGGISLGAGVTTNGGGQSYSGPVTLTANINLSDNSTAGVQFLGTVDGARNLLVGTGTGLLFNAAVGSATPLASINLAAASLTLNGSVFTSGSQAYEAPVITLGGSLYRTGGGAGATFIATGATRLGAARVAVDTTGGGTGAGQAIRFVLPGTIDGPGTLALTSGAGTIAVGPIGFTVPLSELDINVIPALTVGFAVVTGNTTLTAGPITLGKLTTGGTLTLTSTGTITQQPGTGAITANTLTGSANGAVTLTAPGNSIANLGPFSVTGAADFVLSDAANLAVTGNLSDPGGGVTLSVNPPQSLTLGAGAGVTAASFSATAGTIVLNGSLVTSGAQSYTDTELDLMGSLLRTGGGTGATFTETGATVLGGGTTIVDTTGGGAGAGQAIRFTGPGTIDGPGALTLTAGAGTIAVGAIGGTVPLGQLGISLTPALRINSASVTGNATIMAGVMTLGNLRIGGTLTLDSTGAISQVPGTAIVANTLTGSAGDGLSFPSLGNTISNLGAFAVGSGGEVGTRADLLLTDATALTVQGNLAAPGGSVVLVAVDPPTTPGILTLGSGITISGAKVALGARQFFQLGTTTINAPLIVIDVSGLSAQALLAFSGAGKADILSLPSGTLPNSGPVITFQDLEAPSSTLLLALSGGFASGFVNVGELGVSGIGGGADLTGLIGGVGGGFAATLGLRAQGVSPDYRFNGCPIGGPDCGAPFRLTAEEFQDLLIPAKPQAVSAFELIRDPHELDPIDGERLSTGNEDGL